MLPYYRIVDGPSTDHRKRLLQTGRSGLNFPNSERKDSGAKRACASMRSRGLGTRELGRVCLRYGDGIVSMLRLTLRDLQQHNGGDAGKRDRALMHYGGLLETNGTERERHRPEH